MSKRTTKKMECPYCKRDPYCFENQEQGGLGDNEWGEDGGRQEIRCACGALLVLNYDVVFNSIDASKGE